MPEAKVGTLDSVHVLESLRAEADELIGASPMKAVLLHSRLRLQKADTLSSLVSAIQIVDNETHVVVSYMTLLVNGGILTRQQKERAASTLRGALREVCNKALDRLDAIEREYYRTD